YKSSQKQDILEADDKLNWLLNRFFGLAKDNEELKVIKELPKVIDDLSNATKAVESAKEAYFSTFGIVLNPKPRRLTKTQSFEFAARFLSNDKILFSQSGNFFVVDIDDFS